MILTLTFIFVLLLLSALFSGAETALTAVSRPYMHQLEQTGNKRAGTINALHAEKERLIGTILLGNNLVNIMASAMATSVLISIFGETGVIYATIAMTLLILIFSEILPKTYAIHNANSTALSIAPTVRIVVMLFTPMTSLINVLVRGIFKPFGGDYRTSDAFGTGDEELRGAIELHAGEDEQAVRHKRNMLRSVLDLAGVQVSEIMTHRRNATTIDVGLPESEAIDQILASPYTRIPLWRDDPDNIVGVLHAKALLREIRIQSGKSTSIDLVGLAATPWFIPEQTLLLDQLEAFRQRREHFAIVVDEYGGLMGIVTLEDIIEEIVGDIDDEHDLTVEEVLREHDGSFILDGSTTIRDLNRQYDWALPDEEAATLAGLILHESRRIPQVGQSFMFHKFRFDILERQRNQITSIRVTPHSPDDDS
ncbi:MAG: HlyC/CorC family transporter [Rhodospirillales bacterium]|nr:HlyC/CorC family transporter [Rhodospirillales bacterium]